MLGEAEAVLDICIDTGQASMMEMTATTIPGISLHATLNAAIAEVVIIEKVSSWTRCGISLRKVVLTAYFDDWNLICVCAAREQINE